MRTFNRHQVGDPVIGQRCDDSPFVAGWECRVDFICTWVSTALLPALRGITTWSNYSQYGECFN